MKEIKVICEDRMIKDKLDFPKTLTNSVEIRSTNFNSNS
jgi:hypothetical protein